MAVEKMIAQVVWEVDKASLIASLWEVERYARDTGKKLDKETVLNYRINSAKLKLELEQTRWLLRDAKKRWDQEAIFLLTAKTTKLQSDLTQANRLLNNYINTWNANLSRLQAKFDGISWQLRWVNGLLAKFWISIGTYLSWAKLKEFSEAFTSIENRLKQVSEWPWLEALKDKIYEWANAARVGVEEYAAVFTRFDLVNKQLGWSQEETLKIMDSLTKWLSASGAKVSEVSAVMLQLSQAFWSGRLAGDEFRSVSENMPILLDILAKKLWVARWEVKALAADWAVTSEILRDALLDANEQLNASFEKTSITIGQAMTLATNKFIEKFWELDKTYAITQTITMLIDKASDSLIWAVEKAGQFKQWIQLAMVTAANWVNVFAIKTTWGIKQWWEVFTSTMRFVTQNAFILVENIWIAFWNLPNFIWKWLDEASWVLQDWINWAIGGINSVWEKMGVWKILEVNLKTNFGWDIKEMKSFMGFDTSGILWIQSDINRQIDIQNAALEKSVKDILAVQEVVKWELRWTTDWVATTWTTDKGKGWKSELEKQLEKEKKLKEQEVKEDMQRQLKLDKWKRDLEEKRIEAKRKLLEGIVKWIDEEIKKQEELVKWLEEQTKELEKIDDINKKIADRYKGIQEDIEWAKKELIDFGDVAQRKQLDRLTQEVPQSILDSLWKDEILAWWVRVEDLRKYIELKTKINDLQKESDLAKANTSQENIDEAQLSDTQKLINERAIIEESLGLKDYQYEEERVKLETSINEKQDLIEWYSEIQKKLEEKITGTQNIETQKRIDIINKEIAAITRLMAARSMSQWVQGWGATTSSVTNTTNNNGNTTINVNDQVTAQQVTKMVKTVLGSNAKGIK